MIYSKAVVITRPNCTYCTRAKLLLSSHNIPYEEIDAKQEGILTLLEMLGVKTVPQIIYDGEWINGYTELKDRLEPTW